MPLTAIQVRNASPREKDYKLADEKSMYLLVKRNGAKYWRLKYRYAGRERVLALGVYEPGDDGVSLADARQRRTEARKQLADNLDPGLERKKRKIATRERAQTLFEDVARDWINIKSKQWSERQTRDVSHQMEKDIFPRIGRLPISEINTVILRPVIDGVQGRGAFEIARKLRQRCSAVFRHGMALGVCPTDPAENLKTIMLTPPKGNMPALSQEEFPEFMRKMRAAADQKLTWFAIELLALTFVRTSELIGGRWAEIDFDERIWNIPAERMKKSRPHFVPLSNQAVDLLQRLHLITGTGQFLFPQWGRIKSGKTMSNATILRCIDRLGYRNRMSGHGFRAVASTALNESGLFNYDAIERQLAHEEENAVRAAYNKAKYMVERRKLMQWWADRLDELCSVDAGRPGEVRARRPTEIEVSHD